MNEQLTVDLEYYGISPWEIEVIYGYMSSRFKIKQKEIEHDDSEFTSYLKISIPLSFNEEFFKWFEFKRWDKIKFLFKEMERRRSNKKPIKIELCFIGNPEIDFIVDIQDRQMFNNAVEKIDFVLELLPYHLDPEKLPQNIIKVIYKFDTNAARWRLNTVFTHENKYSFVDNGWKLIT